MRAQNTTALALYQMNAIRIRPIHHKMGHVRNRNCNYSATFFVQDTVAVRSMHTHTHEFTRVSFGIEVLKHSLKMKARI